MIWRRSANRKKGALPWLPGAGLCWWLCLALLLSALSGHAAQSSETEQPSVDIKTLQAKISAAEADQDLNADSRNVLIEKYRRSISNLESYKASLAAITR